MIFQIIDSLEKRELTKYAEEVQTLLTVCNKVREEWLGNEQKTKDAILEYEKMKEQLTKTLNEARINKDVIEELRHKFGMFLILNSIEYELYK